MNKMRIWIYCRVSKNQDRYLLQYQKNQLSQICKASNIPIVGFTLTIENGDNYNSKTIMEIKRTINRHEIDCILIYDDTRLFIYQYMLDEFKLFCSYHHVLIFNRFSFQNLIKIKR